MNLWQKIVAIAVAVLSSAKAHEKAASAVAENKQSLHKTEAEDGDDV